MEDEPQRVAEEISMFLAWDHDRSRSELSMVRSIVVGTDGSPTAEKAVEHAAHYAAKLGAKSTGQRLRAHLGEGWRRVRGAAAVDEPRLHC